jgi:hypothetical protein
MGSKSEGAVRPTLKPAFDRNFTSHVSLAEVHMFSLLSAAVFSVTVVLKLKTYVRPSILKMK